MWKLLLTVSMTVLLHDILVKTAARRILRHGYRHGHFGNLGRMYRSTKSLRSSHQCKCPWTLKCNNRGACVKPCNSWNCPVPSRCSESRIEVCIRIACDETNCPEPSRCNDLGKCVEDDENDQSKVKHCNSRLRCPIGQMCHRRHGKCVMAEYDDENEVDDDYLEEEEYYEDAKEGEEQVGFDDEDYVEDDDDDDDDLM